MGILSRISKVLESNLNALLERAEDPAKLLEQAIQDMRKGRDEARQAIIEARTQRRLSEKKAEKALAQAARYEQKAMQALAGNDEDLARQFLECKLAEEHRAEAEESASAEQEAQIAQLEVAARELERRLAEMPARRASLLARQVAADAKSARAGATDQTKSSVASAMSAFERMEERVVRAEVQAEVLTEVDPSLLLEARSEDVEAQKALDELKAKMLALPTPKDDETSVKDSTPKSAKDTLAELKQQVNARQM